MTHQSVTDLAVLVSQAAHNATPEPIWVTGTLTSWNSSRAWTHGELTSFTQSKPTARVQLGCQRRRSAALERKAELDPKAQPDISVLGVLEYHQLYGLRFIVHDIDAETISESAIQEQRIELLSQIHATQAHLKQREMPLKQVQRVGLITPKAGNAGRADALAILERLPITIVEQRAATVGPNAVQQIVTALLALQTTCDVVMIVRGGGASSGLATFNEPEIVHEICRARVPVIVGLGHATDDLVSNVVAHHAATTPTGAANFLSNHLIPALPPAPTLPPPVHVHTGISEAEYVRVKRKLAAAIVCVIVIALLALYLATQ